MNTFTTQEIAQEIADFYQKVADGGEVQLRSATSKGSVWSLDAGGPRIHSDTRDWRIKPKKKVIDLSVLIDSGIDCEFKDSGGKKWRISKAYKGIYQESLYGTKEGDFFEQCKPRMNHIHAWQGGECPLPEGFIVLAIFRNADNKEGLASDFGDLWYLNAARNDKDIIAFEVLGVADGYVMPWEGE
jgi:hypothetical protein